MAVDIDHLIRGDKEVFEILSAKLLVFAFTGYFIELNFDFVVGKKFVGDLSIVSGLDVVAGVHFLI